MMTLEQKAWMHEQATLSPETASVEKTHVPQEESGREHSHGDRQVLDGRFIAVQLDSRAQIEFTS